MKHYIPKEKRKKITLFEHDDYHIFKTERELKKFKVKDEIEAALKTPEIEEG